MGSAVVYRSSTVQPYACAIRASCGTSSGWAYRRSIASRARRRCRFELIVPGGYGRPVSRVRVAVGESVAGNPTGAGDAFTACLATGLAAGDDWPEMLRRSSAVAAAAVARPLAGEFDPDTFDLVLPRITVEELS